MTTPNPAPPETIESRVVEVIAPAVTLDEKLPGRLTKLLQKQNEKDASLNSRIEKLEAELVRVVSGKATPAEAAAVAEQVKTEAVKTKGLFEEIAADLDDLVRRLGL